MPDFITIVTIAGCAGSSLGFWSLGRSINRKGSLISVRSDLSVTSAAESLFSAPKRPLNNDQLGFRSPVKPSAPAAYTDNRSTDVSVATPSSGRMIVHDGLELAIVLRANVHGSSTPVVIGKAQGSAIQTLIKRHESELDDIHLNKSMAKELYANVPLLQPVTETLNIELRHILESSLDPS